MTAIVFRTPSGSEAELSGAERGWLAQLIRRHTAGMWGFDQPVDGTARALALLDMAGPANLARSSAEHVLVYAARVRALEHSGVSGGPGDGYWEAKHHFIDVLKTSLNVAARQGPLQPCSGARAHDHL
jgi:hypothetical protein